MRRDARLAARLPIALAPRLVRTLGSLGAAILVGAASAALPPVPVPQENPITEPKRVLGKILFWDEQLSTANLVSCGTCHVPGRGGADDRLAQHPGFDGLFNTPDDVRGSPGVIRSSPIDDYVRDALFALRPRVTDRAANSPINAAYAPELFWDGRAPGRFLDPLTGEQIIASGGALENQAVQPPMSGVEMAHDGVDWNQITAKLRRVQPLALATGVPSDLAPVLADRPGYPALFRAAFGDDAISASRIAMAIATYQRTLIADQTPWDRFIAGQTNALAPAQAQGFQAFQASRCIDCHQAPHFTDHSFRNIGLRPVQEDRGRQNVTGEAADGGRFKVPSLRNAALKRTFMHNGQFQTLQQVIAFYARAPGAPQQFPENRDPIMQQVNVPPPAAQVITDFLQNALTDPRVAAQAFPFDKPTLYVDRPADQPAIVGGGTPGTGGLIPRLILQSPPLVGNLEFRVGLDAAPLPAGAVARLAVSGAAPLNGRIEADRILGPVPLGADGVATIHWPLEPGGVRDGEVRFVQWLVDDPLAPGGVAASAVGRVRFFCGSAGCPPLCAADFDSDMSLAVADVFAFLRSWFSGSAKADLDGNGAVQVGDIFHFLRLWMSGC